MRAAHVSIYAVVLAGLAALDRVPIVTVEDALVEDSSWSAEERVLSTVVANVVGLTAGLFIGVHSVVVR